MKKSSMVVLVISGALLTGCDSSDPQSWGNSQTYTNNHHVAGRGYYHAPYHAWFPFPYNFRDSSRGYFHGGRYTADPHVSNITQSQPSVRRSTSTSSSRISRGGFSSGRSIGS